MIPSIHWRSVLLMSALLLAVVLVAWGVGFAAWRGRQVALEQALQPRDLVPLVSQGGTAIGPVDPRLHCVVLPANMQLHFPAVSKATMDTRFGAAAEWVAIRQRMKPGDAIYPYAYPTPTRVFAPTGGFVILRGKCVVGTISAGLMADGSEVVH